MAASTVAVVEQVAHQALEALLTTACSRPRCRDIIGGTAAADAARWADLVRSGVLMGQVGSLRATQETAKPRSTAQPRLACLLTLLAVGACGGSGPTGPSAGGATVARTYVETVVSLMQTNSIKRQLIDWTTFRSTVLARAEGVQTIADTYPAIRVALELLGDNHSFYQPATGNIIFVSTLTCNAVGATEPVLPEAVGYVRVPAFSGNSAAATAFARGIQTEISSADREDLVGWIVDLRANGGGNMWPMIAGVGPILGEGLAGYFIDPDEGLSQWEYRDGTAWLAGTEAQRVADPYRLRREQPRVAVLTDNTTNSSGEGVVVAFRQRPNTRSFGTATCGRSTANRSFSLSDGASLFLTVSVMADRTKTKYGISIQPDEIVTDPNEVVSRASAWLREGQE